MSGKIKITMYRFWLCSLIITSKLAVRERPVKLNHWLLTDTTQLLIIANCVSVLLLRKPTMLFTVGFDHIYGAEVPIGHLRGCLAERGLPQGCIQFVSNVGMWTAPSTPVSDLIADEHSLRINRLTHLTHLPLVPHICVSELVKHWVR